MIAEAIDKILELAGPHLVEVGGVSYSDKRLLQVDSVREIEPINVSTLTAFVKYILNMDGLDGIHTKDCIVHVVDPKTVALLTGLSCDGTRSKIIVAKAEPPQIPFKTYLGQEEMIISMLSQFEDDPETDRAAIVRFASKVKAGTVKEYGDDGVTQTAVVKSGVASLQEQKVPSPCSLRPYRTFQEVPQPKSLFIFRMSSKGEDVQAALFPADGGAWKLDAVETIAAWLRAKLDEAGINIQVIA